MVTGPAAIPEIEYEPELSVTVDWECCALSVALTLIFGRMPPEVSSVTVPVIT
jgi:hypothetical protein